MEISYNLRLATKEDIKEIMKIEISSFNINICEEEKLFLERIKVFQDGFYVIEKSDNVVGYISTEIWNYKEKINDSSFRLGHAIKKAHNPEGNELYISSMGMLPEYRGEGLGKAMFRGATHNIIEKHHNIKSEILIVSEKWINARNIYIENGFDEIHNINNFFVYKNNLKENGIVMRKYL